MTVTETGEFDRLSNFRDLGGLTVSGGGRTRHGVLMRSESLIHASAEDIAHLREVVRLRTIVDLRTADQIRADGHEPFEGAGIDYLPVPCGFDGVTAATRPAYYAGLLRRHGTEFAALARRIGAGGLHPLIVHCQLGCDRTGTVIAMLLGLVGVPAEEICADYARSRGGTAAIRYRSEVERVRLGLEPMDDAFYDSWDNAPEVMAATLALVAAEWGGMRGWATAHGLAAAEIDALRAVLVG